MLTICSMASFWPTIFERSERSRDSASRPVSVGSNVLCSRFMAVSKPFVPDKAAGSGSLRGRSPRLATNFGSIRVAKAPNPSLWASFMVFGSLDSIGVNFLIAPERPVFRFESGGAAESERGGAQYFPRRAAVGNFCVTGINLPAPGQALLLRRARRPYFDAADQGALGLPQNIENDFSDILGRDLPGGLLTGFTFVEGGVDATGHDRGYADVIVAMVQHQRLREAVQPELGGIVSGSSRERVLRRQAADVDDPFRAAAPVRGSETLQRLARAIKGARKVGADHRVPFLDGQLGRRPEGAAAGVVYQNVERTHLLVRVCKQGSHLVAAADIRHKPEQACFRVA